jgi:hypothetical protein
MDQAFNLVMAFGFLILLPALFLAVFLNLWSMMPDWSKKKDSMSMPMDLEKFLSCKIVVDDEEIAYLPLKPGTKTFAILFSEEPYEDDDSIFTERDAPPMSGWFSQN